MFLYFSHLIRPDQPISAAADLRSCASGSRACIAGCDRSRASLPVRRKVSVTETRLSTPGQGPASVGCEIFIAARRACSTLHASAPIPVRQRCSSASIASVERVAWLIDDLSPVRYVRQFPCRLRIHPSLLRDLPWSGPFHLDFHSGLPAAPPCRPGTPSTEQRSAAPPPQHESGWAAGRLVARALLGGLPAAARWHLLAPHFCHLASLWLRARFSRSVEPSPPIAHGPWPWPTPTSAAPARNRLCPRYPPHTALPAHPRRDSSIATSLCRVTAPLSFIGFLLITVPASPF